MSHACINADVMRLKSAGCLKCESENETVPMRTVRARPAQQKARPRGRASYQSLAGELLRRSLGVSLERLVGLLGEIGIELADLGRLGDEALIGGLGVVDLDLEGLVERLNAHHLLQRLGAFLERLLRIVGELRRDRLRGLRQGA